MQTLPDTAARMVEQGPPQAGPLIARLLTELAGLETESADFVPSTGGLPTAAFGLAERYERAYAAAACLLLWLENPPLRTGRLGTDGLWLRACLTSLLGEDDSDVFGALADVVLGMPTPEFTLWGGTA